MILTSYSIFPCVLHQHSGKNVIFVIFSSKIYFLLISALTSIDFKLCEKYLFFNQLVIFVIYVQGKQNKLYISFIFSILMQCSLYILKHKFFLGQKYFFPFYLCPHFTLSDLIFTFQNILQLIVLVFLDYYRKVPQPGWFK